MATLRKRIELLERNKRTDGDDGHWDLMDSVTQAQVEGDPEIEALVRGFRDAACREDCDPTLPRQRGLEIHDGPSTEECHRRMADWFERRLSNRASGGSKFKSGNR